MKCSSLDASRPISGTAQYKKISKTTKNDLEIELLQANKTINPKRFFKEPTKALTKDIMNDLSTPNRRDELFKLLMNKNDTKIVLTDTQNNKIKEMIDRFPRLFITDLKDLRITNAYRHTINVKSNAKPIKLRPYYTTEEDKIRD